MQWCLSYIVHCFIDHYKIIERVKISKNFNMPFTHPFKYYNQWPCVVLPVCLAADAFIPSLI